MKNWKRILLMLTLTLVISTTMAVPASARNVDRLEVVAVTADDNTSTGNETAEGEDLFTVAETIIRDVYNQIAGISTILAGLMSAVAVIGAKMSNNQQKSDQAWDWLKRIWLAWAIINGMGAFIAYVTPLFDGYAVLP